MTKKEIEEKNLRLAKVWINSFVVYRREKIVTGHKISEYHDYEPTGYAPETKTVYKFLCEALDQRARIKSDFNALVRLGYKVVYVWDTEFKSGNTDGHVYDGTLKYRNTIVKIQLCSLGAKLPEKSTTEAAGYDLYSPVSETIPPGEWKLIPLGFRMQLPLGWSADIRPRSGLALKYGVTVLNSPGLIDSDYRGVVGVILINHGKSQFDIKQGDRVAQMTFNRGMRAYISQVEFFKERVSNRKGGFGSSGR